VAVLNLLDRLSHIPPTLRRQYLSLYSVFKKWDCRTLFKVYKWYCAQSDIRQPALDDHGQMRIATQFSVYFPLIVSEF